MVTPGICNRNILPYLSVCSSCIFKNVFPSGWPLAPAKNVQAVPMIGRLMGPGRSDIVLIDSFAASLLTLDDNLLNDEEFFDPRSALNRTDRPGTASIERATLDFVKYAIFRLSQFNFSDQSTITIAMDPTMRWLFYGSILFSTGGAYVQAH